MELLNIDKQEWDRQVAYEIANPNVPPTYLLTQVDGTELHVLDGRIVIVDRKAVLADVAAFGISTGGQQ